MEHSRFFIENGLSHLQMNDWIKNVDASSLGLKFACSNQLWRMSISNMYTVYDNIINLLGLGNIIKALRNELTVEQVC